MKTKKRYAFWKVLWVVIAIYIFFGLLGLVAMSIAPTQKSYDWHKILSWSHLVGQLAGIAFSVAFYYFFLNTFYQLVADKKSTIHYIKYSVLAAVALVSFNCLSYYCF